MLRSAALALAVLLAGCFGESPSTGDGGTGTPGCPLGSEGCECTTGDGCDGDLECLQPASVCVQPGCTPGAGLCSCDAGSCADGYVCTQNFCAPVSEPGESSANASTVESADASSTPSTSDATTTGTGIDTGTEDATTSSPTSTDPTADTGVTESSSTGETVTCQQCRLAAQLGTCFDEYGGCPVCEDIWMCAISAKFAPQECCAMYEPQPFGWDTFTACVDNECPACEPLSC